MWELSEAVEVKVTGVFRVSEEIFSISLELLLRLQQVGLDIVLLSTYTGHHSWMFCNSNISLSHRE